MFEDLLDEFEAAWRAGNSPDLAALLERGPHHLRASLLFELLSIEVFYRRRRGESVTSVDYTDRWPTYRSVIERVFSESSLSGEQGASAETMPGGLPTGAVAPGWFSRGEASALGSEVAEPAESRVVQLASESLVPGVWFGEYRLVEPLGIGGMGQVWLAEQEMPVRRQVALKLVKSELKSREIMARFAAERQALALMDHPHIARFLDAGTTPTGQPYFAMEYVAGSPLTVYCDHHQLTIARRLELFAKVCQAVQHAHQKGIIHRDLKPNNILVVEVDGRPVPKVIDFGLAKAREETQSLSDHSNFTRVGQVLGTLKYMSPEQARLSGGDVDTRTDVYALGVILYELLTGVTPVDDSLIRGQAIDEALRLLREKEPLKPSSRLSHSDHAVLSSITAQRSTDRSRLRSLLRGELDWVVMKALEKERERRYQSASAFAEDIERCLAGHAVVARPPSWWYLSRKFLRRHPLGAVIACLLLLMSAAVGLISWQAAQVTRTNERLQRQQATASFLEIVNRRVDSRRGWTWKNQALIAQQLRQRDNTIPAADWRSEWIATQMAVDLQSRDRWLPKSSFFDMRFHPRNQDQWFGLELKGTTGLSRYVWRLTLGLEGVKEESFSYRPNWNFELKTAGKQDGGRSLAFHPDGELVAWGTRAGEIIVRRWDSLERDVKRWSAGAVDVRSLEFSPDGRFLYAASDPKVLRYDVENNFLRDRETEVGTWFTFSLHPRTGHLRLTGGQGLDRDLEPLPPQQFEHDLFNPRYAPHGLYLAGTDQFERVNLHGIESGETLRSLGLNQETSSLSFSADGRFLCAAGEEWIRVWDLYDGRALVAEKLDRGKLRGLFTPDGRSLLVSQRQGIERYELGGLEMRRVVGVGPEVVHSYCRWGEQLVVVYFAADHQQVIVAHWNWRTGELYKSVSLRPDDLVELLPILIDESQDRLLLGWRNPSRGVICTLDPAAEVWGKGELELTEVPEISRWVSFEDGQYLASRNRGLWNWYDLQGRVVRTVMDNSVRDRVSNDAKVAVIRRQQDQLVAGMEGGTVLGVSLGDDVESKLLRLGSRASVSAVALNFTSDRLAVGNVSGQVWLTAWPAQGGMTELPAGDSEVTALQWLDAETLVSAYRDGQVVVWATGPGGPERLVTLLRGTAPVVRMEYCPEHQQLFLQQEGRYGLALVDWGRCRASFRSLGLELADPNPP